MMRVLSLAMEVPPLPMLHAGRHLLWAALSLFSLSGTSTRGTYVKPCSSWRKHVCAAERYCAGVAPRWEHMTVLGYSHHSGSGARFRRSHSLPQEVTCRQGCDIGNVIPLSKADQTFGYSMVRPRAIR